jgi:hypothetical protein
MTPGKAIDALAGVAVLSGTLRPVALDQAAACRFQFGRLRSLPLQRCFLESILKELLTTDATEPLSSAPTGRNKTAHGNALDDGALSGPSPEGAKQAGNKVLSRLFRAKKRGRATSRGIALGYLVAPRWG